MKNILILLVLGLSACAKPAPEKQCGYRQNVYGQNISWKENVPVVLKLDTSIPVDFERDILAAAETWNKVAGKTVIKIDTTRYFFGLQHQDKQNVIYALNSWESHKSSEQARTSVYNRGDEITETDIQINLKDFTFYLESDNFKLSVSLKALMIHELGHVLGLAHNDLSYSTMNSYLANGTDRNELTKQDIENLNCQY